MMFSCFSVVCFDAKINFDDNAEFRQKEVFAMEDNSESDPREVEAAKHNLNYIGMTGNIGCLGKHCFSYHDMVWSNYSNSFHRQLSSTYTDEKKKR